MNKYFRFVVCVFTCLLFAVCSLSCKKKTDNSGDTKTESRTVLEISAQSVEMFVNDTFKLNFFVNRADASVSFSSADESVAIVADDGTITAVGVGETIVTAKADSVLRNCSVKVEAGATYRVKFFDGDITLIKGGEFKLDAALLSGFERTDKSLSFSSTDRSVATVNSDGKVTAVGEGTCEIKAECLFEGVTYEESIKASVLPAAYLSCEDEITLDYSEEVALNYGVYDLYTDEKIDSAVAKITSADEQLLTVRGNLLTANGVGETEITLDYNGISKRVKARCVVSVKKAEFNRFVNADCIKTAAVFHITKYGESSPEFKGVAPALVNKINDTVYDENLLKFSSQSLKAGKAIDYPALFLDCRNPQSEIEKLKEEGYSKLRFEIYIEYADESRDTWVEFSWSANSLKRVKSDEWTVMDLPVDDYISRYSDLAERNAVPGGNGRRYSLMNFNGGGAAYTVYLKPIYFVK